MRKKLLVMVLSILTCAVFVMPVALAADAPPQRPLSYALVNECKGYQSFNSNNSATTSQTDMRSYTDVGFHQDFVCYKSDARYKVTLQREKKSLFSTTWEPIASTDSLSLKQNYGIVWRNVNNTDTKTFRLMLEATNTEIYKNGTQIGNALINGDIHMLSGWFSLESHYNFCVINEPMSHN